MMAFIDKILIHRIEQMRKSAETAKEEITNTSKNVNTLIVNERCQALLNLSLEINLLYEESKISKRVKKMINRLEIKMNNLFKNFVIASTEIEFDNILALAIVYFNLGSIYLDENVNLNAAKNYFMRCMELLSGKELHYKFIMIATYVLLQLYMIWTKLQQLENCYSLLDKALELYLSYTKEDDYPDPFNINDFIRRKDKDTSKIILMKCHLVTLKYMEKWYYLQPIDKHKFVIYVHDLLNTNLKTVKNSIDNDILIDWAEASVHLSIYFLYSNRFKEAKSHLAAAEYMTTIHYVCLVTDENYAESHKIINKHDHIHMFIIKLWAIYGIMLLRLSKERLLQYESNKSCEANNAESESHSKSDEALTKLLIFDDLETSSMNITNYRITDTYTSNFDDIKIIFGNVKRWLNHIHMYVQNQFISQVQAVLCTSKAYKYYVYFEVSKSKQVKIIKQQVKFIENFINILSSKYCTLTEYHYYKILHLELAITYSTLLDIMNEELDEIKEITDEMRIEIRQFVANIIRSFNLFTNIS